MLKELRWVLLALAFVLAAAAWMTTMVVVLVLAVMP